MPYVYQYIDSTTGLPFYIGKGTGSRKDKIGAKVLTFRSPSGEIISTTEWRQFLIDHKLSYNLVRGKGQVYTKGPNAGWSLLKSEYLNR